MLEWDRGAVWPGWETVRLIGRGSFGAVYEIRREVFGDAESCALKHISIPLSEQEIPMMQAEGMDRAGITRSFTEQAKDIVSEYKMLAKLNGCPNVVDCHDVKCVQKDDGLGWDIYIRMELLTPLTNRLRERAWTEEDTLALGLEIGNALRWCRRLHILHRDIKPANIFVDALGQYKLGDFGIARTTERTGSATARIGTFNYMAPEVFHGEHYGASADIYSLGMMLYWLLNERRVPFVTTNTARDKEEALRRRMSGEAIPAPAHGSPELQRIVRKACAYDPQERYHDPEELLRDLEALAEKSAPAKPEERALEAENNATPPREEESRAAEDAGPCGGEETASVRCPEGELLPHLSALLTSSPAGGGTDGAVEEEVIAMPPRKEESRAAEDAGPCGGDGTASAKPAPRKRRMGLIAGIAALLALAAAFFLWPRYGAWSEWSPAEPEALPGRKVQAGTEYRCRELTLLSTTELAEVVGEIDREGSEAGDWGEWSDWDEREIQSSETVQAEEKTQYRAREKEYSEKEEDEQKGWILDESRTVEEWSGWSAWSPEPAYYSDTRKVQTATQYSLRYAVYRDYPINAVEWSAWSEWSFTYTSTVLNHETRERTVYSYSDLIARPCYYRWKEWSDWGFSQIDPTEDMEVETRQVYRSRSKTEVPVYFYYDWSDWGEWSTEPIPEDDSRQVETRSVYRWADRK